MRIGRSSQAAWSLLGPASSTASTTSRRTCGCWSSGRRRTPRAARLRAVAQQLQSVLVTTTERPAGYEVKQALGQVFGVVVRSRGLGGNIIASLRSLGGGEIVEYTRLVEDTRRHAVDRMIENARALGANAVVMMRFDSSELGQTMTEVVAYGTAAIIERSS